jgi:hypothetical protein
MKWLAAGVGVAFKLAVIVAIGFYAVRALHR